MNQTKNILRGHPWLMLLMLFAWLLPQQAAADWYVQRTYQYQVMLNGANTIRIKVPVYDEDEADHWVSNANLKVKWTDDSGTKQDLSVLNWGYDKGKHGGYDNDKSELPVFFQTYVGGSLDITQGNTSNHFTLKKEDGQQTRTVYQNNDGETYDISAVWRVPYDMLGKSLEFEWAVMVDYTAGFDLPLKGLSNTTIDVPRAQDVIVPQLTTASMSYSKEGMLEIPWFMATDKMTKARYEYTDQYGRTQKVSLQTKATSDIIYLDATVPHNNFRVIVSYKDNLDNDIEEISSTAMDLPVIHAPHGLGVRFLGDMKSKMELTWAVSHTGTKDLCTTDQFVIQRSLTGLEQDFEDIGMEMYADGLSQDSIYTFVDSTLIESIAEGHLKGGGTLDNLTYRVRRAMTENWGWGVSNNCARSATTVVSDLHLLRIANYTAKWEDERAYTVRVSWDYAVEPGCVWDDRAQMAIRVTMKNREGAVVDTIRYDLNQADREQRYKVLTLFRPCVTFDVDILVEKGESPLNDLKDVTAYWFPIRTYDDWVAFRDKVQAANGQYDVNARLYADVNAGTIMVGWEKEYSYRGTFDGNGHTLTFSVNDHGVDYLAPFKYVGNATIRNLHTAGTINNNHKYAAGLVASVQPNSTVVIDGCRSSMTLNSGVNGDATNGGFVGVVEAESSNVTFRNCKFDGSFEGANCSHNGGFVGWANGPVNIENSLFAPASINTKPESSETWRRGGGTLTLVNSHATTEFTDQIKSMVIDGKTFMVLHNETDWLNFRNAVNSNPNTNAIMAADFTVHNAIALDAGTVFSGIFDGNGHTLNADVYGGNAMGIALFVNARDYTIKNLHLTGKITGGDHLAGLVGISARSGDVASKILNCRVSTTLESSGWIAGGVVGRGNGADVVNCLFDGYLSCSKTKNDGVQWWVGAFYGFVDGGLNGAVQCCVENGSYKSDIEHKLLNINSNMTSWGNGTNQWSYNNFSYNNFPNSFNASAVSNDYIREKLGTENWELVDGKWLPKMATTEILGIVTHPLSDFEQYYKDGWKKEGSTINPVTTTYSEPNFAEITKPTLPDFYHASNGKIDPELLTTTRQSSVLLAWNTDGNPIDYFKVMRRVQGEGDDKWVEVATDLTDLSYEDKTVSPLAVYEYKVCAVNDCEGLFITETNVKVGESKHTGRVEGYVRFNDGTGAPDIQVDIIDVNTNNTVQSIFTNESGFFEADELSYQGKESVTYKVAPVTTGGDLDLERDDYYVTFNATSNNETVHEFTIRNGRRFSGYVMYEGTSIPVKGANFLVNGKKIHNNKGGYVETDYDGSFSFRLLGGDNTIQAVMDKHVFTNDGFYKNSNPQNITSDVAGIYFYDATKVKLTGRIVGGNDQGLKPLDNNLSKNNLGDSLTMVLTLEGDNTSWLVYDNLNPNKTQREEVVRHPRNGDKHYTTVTTQRKRMVVNPDVKTGEYVLMLPPVRWKVQQVYCKGYPTLFQEGQVSEVIDLTNCLTPKDTTYMGTFKDVDTMTVYQPSQTYNAIYNRIYRAPVEVTYKQIGYDDFDYFGDKNYTATNLAGNQSVVPLAYKNPLDTLQALYTFDFPVFSLERRYGIKVQVGERYTYNNDPAGKVDIVHLQGGKAMMQNGMKAGAEKVTQDLDSLGQTVFTLQADQVTQMLTGPAALRTVTFSVKRDSTVFEAEPLHGYVLNMFALGSGRDILTEGQPILFDILRDPPGGYSSASLAKGATINYSYMMNLSLASGPVLSMTIGQKQETFFGSVQGNLTPASVFNGATTGYNSISDNGSATVQDFVFNMQGSKAYSYTMVLSNAVSTSSDPSMVGADADLYIGTVQNVTVTPMSTIRALPDSMYNEILSQLSIGQVNTDGYLAKYVQYGNLVEIAKGKKKNKDGTEEVFHLVRDLSLGYGPKLKSNFIYSQKQIMTQIIPAKAKEILELMYTGTRKQAEALAKKTQKPVYLSLAMPTTRPLRRPRTASTTSWCCPMARRRATTATR